MVHGVAESSMTEATEHTHTHTQVPTYLLATLWYWLCMYLWLFMYFHLAAKLACVYPRKPGNYRNIFTWKYTLSITPKTWNNNTQHFGILCFGVLFYADFKLRSYNMYRFILYIMTLLLHYSFDVSIFLNSVADVYSLKVKVAQLCSILCDPTDYTVPGIL